MLRMATSREGRGSGLVPRRTAITFRELLIAASLIAMGSVLFNHAHAENGSILTGALCQSNVRQLGLSLFMYSADYDGKLPSSGGSFSGLIASTRQYLRDDSRYHCPADTAGGQAASYRIPPLYSGLTISGGWPDPYLRNIAAEPDRTLLLFETKTDFKPEIAPLYRHTGGTVYLTMAGRSGWAAELLPAK